MQTFVVDTTGTRRAIPKRMKSDILWLVFGVSVLFGVLHLRAEQPVPAVRATQNVSACDANADLARRLVLAN